MKNLFIISLVTIALLIAGCGKKAASEGDEGGEHVKATVAVKATPLRRGDLEIAIHATGRIDALRKQKLLAPVAGRVLSLTALEGASVEAGEVLAVIQTKESQAAVTGAETLVRSAISPEQKAEAQRTLDLAKSSESSIPIRASFSGTVSSRSISAGEFVAENAELFTVIDLSTLVFVADVPARDLPALAIGQRCSISLQALGAKKLSGQVEAVNPQSDAMSQTTKVRVKLLNSEMGVRKLLKIDMLGDALIATGTQRGAYLVPKSALLRNDENNSYTIVSFASDSLAISIPVEVKGMTDSTVAISNHLLKEGMNVVTEGNYALADSTRITVVQ